VFVFADILRCAGNILYTDFSQKKKREIFKYYIWDNNERIEVASEKRKNERDMESSHLWL